MVGQGLAVKFGLTLPAAQQIPSRVQPWEASAGPAEIVAVAQAAERLGFHYVSACDHIAIPQAQAAQAGAVWYDPAVTLAFVAATTTRIRLLSHVVVLPYRHPLAVAKSFATLDHLSGGRVILGVGTGHLQAEFRALGASYADRGRITDEYLQAIVTVWENDPASFHGRFVDFAEVSVAPRPRQRPRPPIWVGGNSRAAARRAAHYAEGWIPWDVTPAAFARTVAHTATLRRSVAGAPLEYVAPLAVDRTDEPPTVGARIADWRAAGATAFHVSVAHDSLDHLVARMEMLAATALPLATP